MVRQDDVLLNSMTDLPFKEYGCALMDIKFLAVMYGTCIFTRESLVEECDHWLKSGGIDKDLVVSWDKIAQDSGLPYKIVIEKGTHKLPPTRLLKDGELQIVLLHNPETGLSHFVVMNKYDQVVFDSLGQSVTVSAYERGVAYIKDRRVFRRIKK